MAGPDEDVEWVAWLSRQLEPLQRALQPLARDIEQAFRQFAVVRDSAGWRRFFEQRHQISRALVAARDRANSPDFQLRLRLEGWMTQQFLSAKDNPSHRKARVWLRMGHLTPKQMYELLPYMMMDMPDLRIPLRKGRPRRPAVGTLAMVEQLAERIERTDELPTTAARRLVTDQGFRGSQIKGRADHLVRLWKQRALKSR